MRIKGLDGLRAIAFLLVFVFHLNWLPFGWMGVQLFFVLSGFLITGILIEMKARFRSKAYFVKFYGRRFLRIFPLYYLYLFLIWLVVGWMAVARYKPQITSLFYDQFPYALAYVYDFFMASSLFERSSSFLTHFWSLAVEEQFYIIWPLLVFLTPTAKQKKVFLAVIAFSFLFRLSSILLQTAAAPAFLKEDPTQVVYVLPFSHMDAFAFGALITVMDLPKARTQFFGLLIALPILASLVDILAVGKWETPLSLGFSLLMQNSYKSVWGYTALNYLFALLIFGVARQGWFLGLLEARPMRYLGVISYGLYVYHLPIIWFLTAPFKISAMRPVPILNAAAALILTVLIASLSYRLVEKPLIDLKDRFFSLKEGSADPRLVSDLEAGR